MAEFVSLNPGRFQAGELNDTKRSDEKIRGDRITWLTGEELEQPLVGATAQFLRTRWLEALAEALPEVPFIPPRLMMAKAMLSVYSGGSVGFVAHTDKSYAASETDFRKLTAVYYLNDGWEVGQGGELVMYPGEPNEVVLPPVRDRLVLLWSDRTTHEVRPTAEGAPDRLAISFWYLEQPQG
mmetsp:Transcript_45783/g.145949  ORF Transcript_45783/g.145949 Transcript_45783/m.145949 type:complete len:182 (+) Transcript_45783:556-1101(+)